jgi:hypothetical protein
MAINTHVSYDRTTNIPQKCFVCKGKCYVPGDSKKTQENAHELLGDTIPNNCVPFADQTPACPAALGFLKGI